MSGKPKRKRRSITKIKPGEKARKTGCVCKHCQLQFKQDADLVDHLKECHAATFAEDTLSCDQCEKLFAREHCLTAHKSYAHNKNIICTYDQCNYKASRRDEMNNHLKSHEKKIQKANFRFQCDECGKEVLEKRRVWDHLRTHYQFKCSLCKKPIKTQPELDAHMIDHKSFNCDVEGCVEVFTTSNELVNHKKRLHKPKPTTRDYACDICGRMFFSSSNLRNHKLRHEEPKFRCTYDGCNQAFVMANLLRNHLITHTGEKRFACEECGKCFARKYGLQKHMDRHRGIKRSECEVCNKRFLDNSKLKVHMRIHTGERPYHCTVCDKRFVQSKDLKLHKDKLHGLKQENE